MVITFILLSKFTLYCIVETSVTKGIHNFLSLSLDYYRFHSVNSISLVVCHEDSLAIHKDMLYILQKWISSNMYIRLLDGHNYESQAAYEASWRSKIFKPPRTFRTDNSTRQPLRLHLASVAHRSGYLMMHFDNPCGLNVLRWAAATENNYFTTNQYWLLGFRSEDDLHLLDDQEIFFPPDSEVRALRSGHIEEGYLVDLYKIRSDGPVQRSLISSSPICMLEDLAVFGSAISHRWNLEGLEFKTGLVIAFPEVFTSIDDIRVRHIDTIAKVNHRLFVELCRSMNARYNTYQMDNYGWHKPNGSFDGLMGRFQRYELDFGQLALFMRLDRVALVDFIAETYRVRAGLMFRQPPLSAVANIFTMPFSSDVWWAVLALLVVTVFVFLLEILFSPHGKQIDFWDCIMFTWGAACQQGFYQNLPNRSARIIIFSTFMAALFLYTSFSANIVALLQSPSAAIKTLQALSESPLEIGVQDTVYNRVFFNESTDSVTNFLYSKKIAPSGDTVYIGPQDGVRKLRHGLFAFQVELQTGYQIISETFSEPEKCGLKEIEPFQLPMLGFPTRKNFPYKELFRRQLRLQRQVGLMKREEKKWFPQKPTCSSGVAGFVSIDFTESRHAFNMLALGMVASFTILLLELTLKVLKGYFLCFGKRRWPVDLGNIANRNQ